MINLRRSSDRSRFKMGIPTPMRQCFISEQRTRVGHSKVIKRGITLMSLLFELYTQATEEIQRSMILPSGQHYLLFLSKAVPLFTVSSLNMPQ